MTNSLGARLGLAPTRVAPVRVHSLDVMTAPSHRSRHSATGCTGDVCGPGRVLVLPVTPEITASFAAAAEAAPRHLRPFSTSKPCREASLNDSSRLLNAQGSTTL